ncbi:MAG: hypothetical protein H6Q72_2983 [Firmicutes bacterium]|nr:hypothetical protein [Bacillota bacterium]
MQQVLRVKDRGIVLEIGFEDLVKYHGRFYIGGVALAFKLLELGFKELVPNAIPEREFIGFTSGLGLHGPGVIDAVEMVTRAKTRGQLVVETDIVKDKPGIIAPDGVGKYYFVIRYADKQIGIAVKPDIIPDEFMVLSRKTHAETITETEKIRLQEVKENLATQIVNAEADELFTIYR